MGINEKAWGVGFKRLIGDESLGATYGICLDNTTKQLHICDIEDAGTDWGLSADSYPSVYIHDIAAPITDYVKIYHNGTNGIIDCDGTAILTMTATSLVISSDTEIQGDLDVTSEDISLAQGQQLYFDGPAGTEYIMSDTEHYLEINAGTGITLTIGDTDEVAIDATNVTLGSNHLILTAGNLTVATAAYIYLDGGTNDYIRTVTDGNVIANGATTSALGVGGTAVITAAAAAITLAQAVTCSSTLTVGANTDGHDVKFFGDTTGAYMLWDEDEDYLIFAATGRLEVGTFAAPITLDSFTGNEDIHTAMVSGLIHAAMTSGEVSRNLWSRMKITADQTQNVSIFGACLQCRPHTGSQTVELSAGLYAGAWLYFEASDTANVFTLSGAEAMGAAVTVEAAAGQLLTTGSVYGVKINSAVNDGINVSSLTSFSAIYINGGSGKENWTTGIEMVDCEAAIDATCVSGGISLTASTLHASTGRIGKFVGSVADAAQGDGYGVFEVQANFSGTVPSGSVANASSFWINLAGSTVTAGTMVCVQNNGIWGPGGLTVSTSNFIIGMRMHCEIGGGTQPQRISCFSINVPANHITSLWQINVIEDINTTSTKSGAGVGVPFLMTSAGTVYYVNAWTA